MLINIFNCPVPKLSRLHLFAEFYAYMVDRKKWVGITWSMYKNIGPQLTVQEKIFAIGVCIRYFNKKCGLSHNWAKQDYYATSNDAGMPMPDSDLHCWLTVKNAKADEVT